MKFSKLKFTVKSSKDFRAQRLEGEAEGKLGQELRLEGTGPISKIKGLFTNAEAFQADVLGKYNKDGELISNSGWFDLTNEGRACKLEILFSLTETNEFEDAAFDCIKIKLEEGKVFSLKSRLRVSPDNKQLARIPHWLKNEITMTLNGETITAAELDEDEGEQPQLKLGAPKDEEEEDHPRAGPSEVLPGVPAAHQESAKALQDTGVISTGNGKKQPPSTAHGVSEVPGQPPPQRPARRRPGEKTH